MKNAFLKKSCTKCSGETSHRPCLKSEIEIWINSPEVSNSVFLLYVQVEDYENILKSGCQPLASTSYKTFIAVSFNQIKPTLLKGLEGENLTLKAAVLGVVTNYCLTCLFEDRRKLTIS